MSPESAFATIERAVGRTIRRTKGTGKVLRLAIRAGQLELKVPPGTPEPDVLRFLRSHLGWMRKHLDKHDVLSERGEHDFSLENGSADHIPVFGVRHTIVLTEAGAPYRIDQQQLWLLAEPGPVRARHAKKQLINALSAILHSAVMEDVRFYAQQLGVSVRKITIKAMRTLWGSLGPQDSMSINFALIFAPRHCTRYIVAHELSHVLERNHSERFWAHVDRVFPERKISERYLHQQHAYLMALQKQVLSLD